MAEFAQGPGGGAARVAGDVASSGLLEGGDRPTVSSSGISHRGSEPRWWGRTSASPPLAVGLSAAKIHDSQALKPMVAGLFWLPSNIRLRVTPAHP
ncbi:hypothetical protein ABZ769_20590 [Streptomyces olivoreticuli]